MTKYQYLLIVSTLAIVGQLVVGQPNTQDEDFKKHGKMILCGECKDAGVRADLQKFKDCTAELYPKEMQTMMAIREANKSNPDVCMEKMMTEMLEYSRKDPAGVIKVTECFNTNVVRQHLDKCH
ncbi:uncharacterized protein LOC128952464 [Oppia nitens]|uniref:uncharacterized protein LOC128952464 n=1 Tax=Oppia nitens TaxID=1686743 RepID=UPI0023DB344D|nr:uncharacterized protein LOC128952464 [Oppia nitens]